MTEDFEPINEVSKEEIDQIFKEALDSAERLHNQLASATMKVGISHQILITQYPRYLNLFDNLNIDPELYSFVVSGLNYVKNLTSQFNTFSGLIGVNENTLGTVVNSTESFASSTDAAISISGIQETPGFELIPAALPHQSTEEYVSRLKALDISLVQSYKQVWQTYYGTSADRYRASLFMMRQVYDHFFSILAPDDLVRKSKYWKTKKGEDPDQIFRSERVTYAAYTHITDIGLADILAASAKQINNLYEEANKAHNRGKLDENNANKTIIAMDSTLKDWIDALP